MANTTSNTMTTSGYKMSSKLKVYFAFNPTPRSVRKLFIDAEKHYLLQQRKSTRLSTRDTGD